MNVAVLCPGPSLPRHWARDKRLAWDLVIAVNTAGWLYDCDWLCFADRHIGDGIARGDADPPRIGYCTHARTPLPTDGQRREPLPLRNVTCRYASLLPRGEDRCNCSYTFPNALTLARRWVRDVDVHVYGFDCAALPHDVALQGGNHNLSRWLSELPWIKHAWDARTQVHSDLPGAVQRWLAIEDATPAEWSMCRGALEQRCAPQPVAT